MQRRRRRKTENRVVLNEVWFGRVYGGEDMEKPSTRNLRPITSRAECASGADIINSKCSLAVRTESTKLHHEVMIRLTISTSF